MGQAATALRAEHAKTVRVVEQQQGVVAFTQRQQRRHVGHITVHAEHGVADDEFAPGWAVDECLFQRRYVGMRVAVNLCAGQPGAVNQASVVQRV